MIARIWHGYTSKENATAYEHLLQEEIFEIIAAKNTSGYRGIKVLKNEQQDECAFVTIMYFDDMDTIVKWMGADYEKAFVVPEAQRLLKRYDQTVTHYQVVHNMEYNDDMPAGK